MKRLALLLPKFFVIIAATLAALALASSAQANNYPVSTADELQDAVVQSNANPGPDTITVSPGFYDLSQTLQVRGELEINGPTNGFAYLDGGGSLRELIYVVCCSGDLTVRDLEIQNGRTGVLADGIRLHMERTTVSSFSEIGVWDTNGDTEIVNSTISGNETGIEVETGGANPLVLRNVTITENNGFGGGLANFGTTIAHNTIIADNSGPNGDCDYGAPINAGSNNLDSDGTCGPTAFTAPPLLGSLQDNGGSTETHTLLDGSPAIDAGTNVNCPATDQRGVMRPVNLLCDIGAVEKTPFEFEGNEGFVGAGESLTTDTEGDGATASDPVETTVTHPTGGSISIREGPGAAAEFGFIGQRVVLDVSPDATAANPIVIIFLIDSSVMPPGQSAATIEVLKNGVPVPPCTGAPQAVPDPCVSSRQTVGDDAEITVLTSDASNWDFAPGAAPPPPMPELSIGDATVTEPDAGAILAQFTVTRTGDTSGSSSVDFQTANGTATAPADYVSNAGTVTFVPGDTQETVTVQVNGDTVDEGDESFFVNLSNPSGATIVDGQGQGTILDNDTATISIGDDAVIEDDSGMTPAGFRVTLSTPSASTVTVDFNTADGTAMAPGDYLPNAGPLVFMPGETVKAVTVQVNGDTIVEPDESFFVNLSNAVGASIADGQGEGTILDDDLSADFDARVNGKGSIGPGHDLRKFKVKARFTNGLPRGRATYVDRLASPRWTFQSTAFTRLTCVGTLATIEGAGRVNGSPVSFVIRVRDLGNRGMGDMFSIEWSGSSSYGASGPLTSGDIKIKDC